jgi:hypothetical protein
MHDDSTNDRTDSDHTTADARRTQTRRREVRVSRGPEGDPIGAAVFLTADELRSLGVEPARTDAVNVSVEDGEVRFRHTESP